MEKCQSGNGALINLPSNRPQFHLNSFRIFPSNFVKYRMESIIAITWKNINLATSHWWISLIIGPNSTWTPSGFFFLPRLLNIGLNRSLQLNGILSIWQRGMVNKSIPGLISWNWSDGGLLKNDTNYSPISWFNGGRVIIFSMNLATPHR